MWNWGRIFQVTVTKEQMLFFPLMACDLAKCTCLYSPAEFNGTTHAGKITFVARIGLVLPLIKQDH